MSCTEDWTAIRGWYMWIQECPDEPGLWWRLTCDGPIEWTAPRFDLTGDQHLTGDIYMDGFAELRPIADPGPPLEGCRLYVDEADGFLKAIMAGGAVKVLAP